MFELHKDEIADIKQEKCNTDYWHEMSDADLSLQAIISDLKAFEESFDNNYYHSEKPAMSDQFEKLNAMLSEFKDELVFAQKNVCSYYK